MDINLVYIMEFGGMSTIHIWFCTLLVTENLTCEIPADGAPTGLMESLGYMVALGYMATLGYMVARGRVRKHVWMELWSGDW